jgi:hypothetical protein
MGFHTTQGRFAHLVRFSYAKARQNGNMGRLALNADGLIAGFPGAPINVVQIQDAESLLFFLQCLTDQRVLHEQGPFDHPSINIPNGFEGNDPTNETLLTVSEVGTNGGAPPTQFPSSK